MTKYRGSTRSATARLSLYEKIMRHTHEEDGHLIWDGSRNVKGYAIFGATDQGRKLSISVRPFLWRRVNPGKGKPQLGRDPSKCDRPDCILPEHQMDLADRPLKPRAYRLRVVRGYRVKLIQNLGQAGYRPKEISEGLGLPLATVQRILNRD